MLRRLVLVGLLVPMQGSTMQLIFGTVFALFFMLFQVQTQPFKALDDDYLASACSFSLVVIFVVSYAFKEAALIDLADIQNKMSLEQRETYVIDYARLSLILLASVAGALLVSFVIFLVQLKIETNRAWQEARMATARRLHYKESGDEVLIYVLPKDTDESKFWHVFLSHTWVQGQASDSARC